MNAANPPSSAGSPTRPYLVRALHDWCTDNGFTPYIAVHVDKHVLVPMEYVKNNEIVLNIGFEATTGLSLGNDVIEFKARFGGVSRELRVPVDHVIAIYARENGQGMAFPMPSEVSGGPSPTPAALADSGARPGLRLADEPARDEGPTVTASSSESAVDTSGEPPEPVPPAGGGPALKRVK